MFERFTAPSREVVVHAQQESRSMGHSWIGTEHLILALAADPGIAGRALADAGVVADDLRAYLHRLDRTGTIDPDALRTFGIDLDDVRRSVEESFGPGALEDRPEGGRGTRRRRSGGAGHVPFTQRAKKSLELALREAVYLEHGYIGTEHVLLGVLRDGGGVGMHMLASAGVDAAALRSAVLDRLRRSA